MIHQGKKGCKLRGRAAETRGLIPFALELCNSVLSDADPFESSIKTAALHMVEAYDNLSPDRFDADSFSSSVRSFLVLWTALQQHSPHAKLWRAKPKFHLFAELSLLGNCPSQQWVYRDEDFGGTAAKLSRRRGGKNAVLSTARNLLLKFYSANRVPTL